MDGNDVYIDPEEELIGGYQTIEEANNEVCNFKKDKNISKYIKKNNPIRFLDIDKLNNESCKYVGEEYELAYSGSRIIIHKYDLKYKQSILFI